MVALYLLHIEKRISILSSKNQQENKYGFFFPNILNCSFRYPFFMATLCKQVSPIICYFLWKFSHAMPPLYSLNFSFYNNLSIENSRDGPIHVIISEILWPVSRAETSQARCTYFFLLSEDICIGRWHQNQWIMVQCK